MLRLRRCLALLALCATAAPAAVVTVTGTGDAVAVDGSVTLREALASVNAAADVNADVVAVGAYGSGDTVAFAIPGAGPHTIGLGAVPLPVIARPVLIDGYTQPGSSANTLAVGDDAVLEVILQGTAASGVHGLEVGVGGSGSTIRGLVLQRHFFAVQINGSNVTVAGNFIGTDVTGTASDADTTNNCGVNVNVGNIGNNVIGGSTPAERNVISGNGVAVVLSSQNANRVSGNYIGVGATGTAAVPNGSVGISIGSIGAPVIGGATIGGITATPGQGAGNVISGNDFHGILIQTTTATSTIGAVTIQGNIFGLDANGANALPNAGANVRVTDDQLPISGTPRVGPVTIGGAAAGAGNVLSASGYGVYALAAGTVIQGNRIGTDVTGTVARPNAFGIELPSSSAFAGSTTIGGTGANEGNVVSGNTGDAIRVFLTTATIQGNRIGVTAGGAPLGNGGSGVFVDSGLATVGGTAPGAGNVIANNGQVGVRVRIGFAGVRDASEAAILGNSITANTELGINDGNDLVTANDAGDGDAGANDLQNFPVITSATLGGGNVTLSGTLNSTANGTFRVELFSNAACDSFGNGEGASYLGFVDVATDGTGNGAFGPSAFPVPAGEPVITATATDAAGHTSEFSSCVVAAGGPPPQPTLAIAGASAAEGNAGTTPFQFTVTLSAASATPVTVQYATEDGSALAPADYAATSGTLTFTPGGPLTQSIQVNVAGEVLVEADETFVVRLSNPSGATLAASTATGTIVNDDRDVEPPGPSEIPTLSQWGALALGALLAALGAARLRSRAVPPAH